MLFFQKLSERLRSNRISKIMLTQLHLPLGVIVYTRLDSQLILDGANYHRSKGIPYVRMRAMLLLAGVDISVIQTLCISILIQAIGLKELNKHNKNISAV